MPPAGGGQRTSVYVSVSPNRVVGLGRKCPVLLLGRRRDGEKVRRASTAMQRKPGGYDRVPQQEEHPTLSSDGGRARARLRYVGHRRPPPPKTTLAAVLMLVVGTVMAVMGVWHMIQGDGSRGGPHLLIGGILLLPGSYASFNLLGAYLGWPGYDYSSIPSYDD